MDQASIRIRDNQRRSRARRSGYLKELEERWQNCRVTGVEASAEIQSAARNVLNENRRLRALLKERGVDESEIDQYLRGSDVPLSPVDSGYVAPILSTLLASKRACDGPESACPTSKGPSMTTRSTPNAYLASQTSSPTPSSLPAGMIPGPMGDLASTPYQQLTVPSPSLLPLQADLNGPTVTMSLIGQPQNTAPWIIEQHVGQPVPPIPQDLNTSSCYSAADILTSMGYGIDAEQVRAEMGCHPNTDCNVDNKTVFNLVDRYTSDVLGRPLLR